MLSVTQTNATGTILELERKLAKLNVLIREQKVSQTDTTSRLLVAEGEAKKHKLDKQKLEVRIQVYQSTLRDHDFREKQQRARFETLNKSSQIVMRKIMALTMRLKRQEVSNEDLSQDNERLSDEMQEQLELMREIQREHQEFKRREQENGGRRVKVRSDIIQGDKMFESEFDVGDGSSETDSIGGMDIALFQKAINQ
jgi:chromosome segregation ATPase